ncbi:peptidylprolyl isomerase [Oceanidesulfovibrio indonesiensis]|uniref:Periplasmic chaperone PpiD n=1 Tax=Oceanidesulfovibrio indonesiensis TaxID=54767 RepID=A0A7M3MCJ7_9BACT|nr:peptidylprolyl isomerase [Oceanidesulfovibrio indonesiensis]TVM16195.1 peptidylprolyl isomerase [Oceanidesulfovibrio indonesiensis]
MLDAIRQSATSWGVKVLFGIIILVFVFWGVGSIGDGSKTQVVATVNERPILAQTFRQAQQRAVENMRQRNPEVTHEELRAMGLGRQVLESLVAEELLAEKAAQLGVTVSDVELRQKIYQLPYFQDESGQFDPDLYRRILNSQRIGIAEFEDDMRRSILSEKIERYVTHPAKASEEEAHELFGYSREKRTLQYLLVENDDYLDQVNATDEEVAAYYEENKEAFSVPMRLSFSYLPFTPSALASKVDVPEEYLREEYEARIDEYMQPEQVKARHILIEVAEGANEAIVEQAKREIETVRMRVVELDEDFATVAMEVSDGPSAVNGGDLGWFTRGQMVEAFEEAAFSLEPGAVSEPVRTPFGFHIILVEDREDEHVTPFEDAKESLKLAIAEDRAADLVSNLLDVALEQIYAGDSLEAVANDLGLAVRSTDEPLTRDGAQMILALTDKALDRLFSMEEGYVTDTPLETVDGYVLATVEKRLPPDYEPLEDVRETIAERIRQDKAEEMAKAEAEQLAERVQESGVPAELADALETSRPFDRQGLIEGLGMNQELTQQAFAAEKGAWLTGAWAVNDGYIVASLHEITPPTQEQWATEKAMWVDFISESKKEELFRSFLNDLQQKAEVLVYQQELIQ